MLVDLIAPILTDGVGSILAERAGRDAGGAKSAAKIAWAYSQVMMPG